MPHASGNPPWEQYPSTATPITAARLEALENAVDAATAAARRIKGPYSPGSYSALASGASGRTAGSVVVPDPGYDWLPLAFGQVEARCGSGSRAALGIYRQSVTAANMVAHGAGLDPVNQGSGGNGYWMIPATPYYGGNAVVAAGATAAARTFLLCPITDYGSAAIESTLFYAQMMIWAVPA